MYMGTMAAIEACILCPVVTTFSKNIASPVQLKTKSDFKKFLLCFKMLRAATNERKILI